MATTEVKTGYGIVRGAVEDAVAVFRGIPFAATTEGAGRFAPPRPAGRWEGVLDATKPGRACPQRPRAQGPTVFNSVLAAEQIGMSEDCLNLNVWTPAADEARRPVLFWIHGGAFATGTGAAPTYEGRSLAARGDLVVVTINYRLGPLGFIYLPEIGSVNIGLLDQIAALEWVRDEISNFGGDPDNVTIFGESAGGKSVECLVASPRARRLFRRAIAQSTYAPPMDIDAANRRAQALLDELEIPRNRLERLRELPVDDLLSAHGRVVERAMADPAVRASFGATGPVIDQDLIPQHPAEALRAGAAKDIPLIVGTTLDEFKLFAELAPGVQSLDDERLRKRLARVIPGAADDAGKAKRAAEVYRRSLVERSRYYESDPEATPAEVSPSPGEIWMAAQTDQVFRQHSIRLAEAQSAHQPHGPHGARTYMYLFTWPAAAFDGRFGACHAVDVPFVFSTFDGPIGQLIGDSTEARTLAGRVQDAWISFAKTGDPTTDAVGRWPVYDVSQRTTMILGPHCRAEQAPLEEERLLWNRTRT